jgi:hypothetical protein
MADSFVVHADGFGHIDKAPAADLKYTWDLTRWLAKTGNPTIASAAVVADVGITVSGAAAIAGPYVTQLITGGTLGESYKATLHFTTSDGQDDYRTIVLDVRAR